VERDGWKKEEEGKQGSEEVQGRGREEKKGVRGVCCSRNGMGET
jgi:hypothetical protein